MSTLLIEMLRFLATCPRSTATKEQIPPHLRSYSSVWAKDRFIDSTMWDVSLAPKGQLALAEVAAGENHPEGETGEPQTTDSTGPTDTWADYRDGPGGPWLTAEHCWTRYGVSNPVLSREAKKDPSIRRKNPAGGSGYVYRYDVVSRIANQKSQEE